MIEQHASAVLSQQDIRGLKSRLHQLRPAVVIHHNRLDNWTYQNIDLALDSNELIKIRTRIGNSEELRKVAHNICASLKATLIQTVGQIIAIYRKNPEEIEGELMN